MRRCRIADAPDRRGSERGVHRGRQAQPAGVHAQRHRASANSSASAPAPAASARPRPGTSPPAPARWSRCSTPASPTTAISTPTSCPATTSSSTPRSPPTATAATAIPSDPGDAYGGNPSSWHGTHVAGTVAAVTNNAKGVAGTAFSAKVVPVRVLGKGGGYDSDIADAVIWASGGTRQRRARECQSGRSDQPEPRRQRRLRQRDAERDQRRGRSRHHAGHRRGQQQRQCFGLLAGELRQCRRRRFDHQHRRALELLQLRRRRRHRGARLERSCPRSTPAPPVQARKPMRPTAAPRWRRRMSPASSR